MGSDTVTKTSYITVGDTPPVLQAEFTASTQEGRTPREVSFRDRSSGNIDSWSWDFGDGQTSTEQNPTHTYLTPGLFTVTLTITDVDDISTTEQKEAFVSVIIFDKSLDNVDYPKTHFSSKTILFRNEMEISKDELKYARMFYLSCNSGNYYIDTFNRGILFHTLNTSAMEGGTGFALYLQAYLEGKSDQEIWEILQGYEAVFDYYDFNKLPSEQ
jgi:PKD repeat protein